MTGGASPALPPIVLTGPIALTGEAARGGFQACNRRTIEALRERGHDITAWPYPHPRARGVRKLAEYVAGFLGLYARAARCRSGTIVHITAHGAHFAALEWVLLQIARMRGCKVNFDIRAGVAHRLYQQGGGFYRRMYAHTLRSADHVMVEGEAFVPFVTEITGQAPSYFPNHIDVDVLPRRAAPTSAEAPSPMRLVYVGRIVPEKGLGVVIDTCRALVSAGERVHLSIAGDGTPEYLDHLKRQAEGLDVDWLGPRTSPEVLQLFLASHFFLFPTSHVGEGQSNALTEAMACGCVPVASDHGFNAGSIADCGATLRPGSRGADYANVVLGIWRTPGRWAELSRVARERVEARFATGPVIDRLVEEYRQLVA